MRPPSAHVEPPGEPDSTRTKPGWHRALWPPDPIASILLLAALFDWISGNPVHALFLGSVGLVLGRETLLGRRPDRAKTSVESTVEDDAGPGAGSGTGGAVLVGGDGTVALSETVERSRSASAGAHYRTAFFALGGIVYAIVVASFSRYSWPATVAVAALGAAFVAWGWEGTAESRSARGPLSRRGVVLWAAVFVASALWELAALLMQPTLTTDSYIHPTVSVLTDPLLASHEGRTVVLLLWLASGWYLVRRRGDT